MGGVTQDGTVNPTWRDQFLRRERGHGKFTSGTGKSIEHDDHTIDIQQQTITLRSVVVLLCMLR